jgi:predicted N-formylglutamate amidohydrolase
MSDPARPLPPLLSPGEPPAFELVNPAGRAPVLFVCDHASRRVPCALGSLGLKPQDFARHIAWDIGAAEVTRRLAARFEARSVLANYSRLVIDLNRAPGDPTLVTDVSDETIVPGNHDLPAQEIERRMAAIFRPYHGAVAAAVAGLRARGPEPAVIAVHSFTPVFDGRARPWQVGILWQDDGRLAIPILAGLSARPGICAGDNEPYSGADRLAYTVAHHAKRHGLPHVAIEIRQDLIDTEDGASHWAGLIGDILAPVLADPGLYRAIAVL